MQVIPSPEARKTLESLGFSDDMIQSIFLTYNHSFPKNVVDYIVALRTYGMSVEQIKTVIYNSTGAMEIFNVRRFFREIAPARHQDDKSQANHHPDAAPPKVHQPDFSCFGFTKEQVENDIRAFDEEMQQYGHELIKVSDVNDICQSPYIAFEDLNHRINILYMIGMCTVPGGKFYRAGIEFIEWAKRGKKPDDKIVNILQKCIGPDGVNMKRLLRLTTGGPDFAGRSMVSHGEQKTIKPMVRNIRYACDVLRFFDHNKQEIYDIAQKYTDIDFIFAFYALCMNWPGWSWTPMPPKARIPIHKTTLREGLGFVMKLITGGLPTDIQHMIMNIAVREFVKIVPSAEYEPWYGQIARVMDPRQQR